ncbi:MAG: 4-hydroxythreonine-4-phosphate dehydrogenase PdxA [Polyangiaceae bacterium UTPRO1]|jgi:4-hydroxythreonine-4-phosphate dehydrogenase|nr:4-hydroxythreonine-4-phosphate dehydrogenase PdxA [Myxococcales bacterium]OQY65220.1 MAG: 4-hydroxythreonine-4-phosphate dehydrogenase PdxA [Polyangiaceae bacterium UTPRO1]
MALPTIGITMGDAAGISPEILAKSLADPALRRCCEPVVIGDLRVIAAAAEAAGLTLPLRAIERPSAWRRDGDAVAVVDYGDVDPATVRIGVVDPALGAAAVRYTREAARYALRGEIDAIVSAPLNKESMRAAGFRYEGATEIFAEEAGVERYAMVLLLGDLRLLLLTNHMSLREACDKVTKARVLEKIMLAHEALVGQGMAAPRIAVSALNPHAGEGGLFGREEIEEIAPAIAAARAAGVNAIGPVPADTVFFKAKQGMYDLTIALYHDQGLGAVKLLGFGDVVTLLVGLPFIRTSTGHGTAFDIAGKGIADHKNLLAAIETAADLAVRRRRGPAAAARV